MLHWLDNQWALGSADVKEYFDVSVYRNILDMLNAFDTSTVAVANYFHNRLVPMGRVMDKMLKKQSIDKIQGKFQIAGPAFGYKPNFGKHLKVFWPIMNDALKAGGTQSINGNTLNPAYDPYVLLDLARSLEWEMNRVRLPVPHNFRQLASKLSGRDYTFKVTKAEGVPGWLMNIGITDDGGMIPAIELLTALPQVKTAVTEMRNAVRKEIDAAKLADQVEEATLRREQEELIAREQAAQEAAERAETIRAEKEANYRDDFELILDQLAEVETVVERNTLVSQANTVLQALSSVVSSITAERAELAGVLAQVDAVLADIAEQEAAEQAAQEAAEQAADVEEQQQALAAEESELLAEVERLVAEAQAAQTEAERQAYLAQLREYENRLIQVQQALQNPAPVPAAPGPREILVPLYQPQPAAGETGAPAVPAGGKVNPLVPLSVLGLLLLQ